jgi:hypothetical protein
LAHSSLSFAWLRHALKPKALVVEYWHRVGAMPTELSLPSR